MLLLVLGVALADARSGADTPRVRPYLLAVVGPPWSPESSCSRRPCRWSAWTRATARWTCGRQARAAPTCCRTASSSAGLSQRGTGIAAAPASALRGCTRYRLERAQVMRRTMESRLQAMQACIEPQFLFDTLADVETTACGRSQERRPHAERAHRLPARGIAAPQGIDVDRRQGVRARVRVSQHPAPARSGRCVVHDRSRRRRAGCWHAAHGASPADRPCAGGCTAGGGPRHAAASAFTRSATGCRWRCVPAAGAFGAGGRAGEVVAGVRDRLHTLYGEAARLELRSEERQQVPS